MRGGGRGGHGRRWQTRTEGRTGERCPVSAYVQSAYLSKLLGAHRTASRPPPLRSSPPAFADARACCPSRPRLSHSFQYRRSVFVVSACPLVPPPVADPGRLPPPSRAGCRPTQCVDAAAVCVASFPPPQPRPASRDHLDRPAAPTTATGAGRPPGRPPRTGRRGCCGGLGAGLAATTTPTAGSRPLMCLRRTGRRAPRCRVQHHRYPAADLSAACRLSGWSPPTRMPPPTGFHPSVATTAAATAGHLPFLCV